MKALVFLEQRDGKLKTSSLEALSVAAQLAQGSNNVYGLLIGSSAKDCAKQAQGYGASKIFTVNEKAFDKYNVLLYANALNAAIDACGADTILGIASPMGRDLFPRVAARRQAGLLTDLIEVSGVGELSGGIKPMYAGKVRAKVAFKGKGLRFATLRPNVFSAKNTGQEAVCEDLAVSTEGSDKLVTVEIKAGSSNKADLTEAVRIISGGRAMGNAENFKILHECAEVLGATVGASRAAVDSGYATHDMQVGQTGKTVNPQLYIACGISGSIQHMAGMRTSKVIIAINTDADAPIFSIADYGIVGDLFEAVPLLTKKFKQLLG